MRRPPAAALAAALLVPAAASGFVLLGAEWAGGDAPLHVGAVERSSLRSALVDAARDWEDASHFDFALIFDDEGACDRNAAGIGPLKNGVELDWRDCDGFALGFDTLAVTMFETAAGEFVRVGAVFNEDLDWEVYDGPWRNEEPDFRRVALHELGHWLGLDHEPFLPAIMQPVAGDLARLAPDDVAGVRFLYGPTGPAPPPDPPPLPPEVACRRTQLRAAGTLCRSHARCEARRAGKPAKDPVGAARDACQEKAARRFDLRIQKARLRGGCLWEPLAEDARSLVVAPLESIEAGVLAGADPASRADARLRKKLLQKLGGGCRRGLRTEARFAKHGNEARRARQRSSDEAKLVKAAGRAVEHAERRGVSYTGPSPAALAESVAALIDDFAAAAD